MLVQSRKIRKTKSRLNPAGVIGPPSGGVGALSSQVVAPSLCLGEPQGGGVGEKSHD